jgi:hypothetical protein
MKMTDKQVARVIGFNLQSKMDLKESLSQTKNEKERNELKRMIKNLRRESAFIYREYRKSIA